MLNPAPKNGTTVDWTTKTRGARPGRTLNPKPDTVHPDARPGPTFPSRCGTCETRSRWAPQPRRVGRRAAPGPRSDETHLGLEREVEMDRGK